MFARSIFEGARFAGAFRIKIRQFLITMKDKIIIPTVLFAAVLIFSFFVLPLEKDKSQLPINEPPIQENQESGQIILFYADSCPHCAIVEKYIEDNDIKGKISFTQKEVSRSQNNIGELTEKAEICGLSTDSIGVPFLWDGKNCLIGDQKIIAFFKKQTDEQ